MTIPAGYRLTITLLLMAMIVALSIVPGRHQPGDSMFVWLVSITPSLLQKIMHVLVYAALAYLWMWTLSESRELATRIALSLVITIATGGILEWYQTTVPGRFGTLTDVILNACGASLGLLLAIFILVLPDR